MAGAEIIMFIYFHSIRFSKFQVFRCHFSWSGDLRTISGAEIDLLKRRDRCVLEWRPVCTHFSILFL